MILKDDITRIGYFIKPHGIKGEISASVDDGLDVAELSCIIVDVEGIYVPFFINAVRPKGADTVLLTIDGVDDEKQAAEFAGKDLFARADEVEDEESPGGGLYLDSLVGYALEDESGSRVGSIVDVDYTSDNLLLVVRRDDNGQSVYVPIAEELICGLDDNAHVLRLVIAEGLLDL